MGAALGLAGCASQIMQGYVGQPVQVAMVDYGPPVNAIDMGGGARAFQWLMTQSFRTPVQTTNNGVLYPVGNSLWWTQNTTVIGGQTVTNECLYTLLAQWSEERRVWVVTGFRKPPLRCE